VTRCRLQVSRWELAGTTPASSAWLEIPHQIMEAPPASSLTCLTDSLVESIGSLLLFEDKLALASTAKRPRATEHDPFAEQLIVEMRLRVPECLSRDAGAKAGHDDPSTRAEAAIREAQRCIPGILRRLKGVTTLVLGPDRKWGPLIAGLAAAIQRQGCRWIEALRFEGLDDLRAADLGSIIRALRESEGGLQSLTALSVMEGVKAAIPMTWVGEFVDLCPRLEGVAVTISREDPRQFAWALDMRERRLSSTLSRPQWSHLRRLTLRMAKGRVSAEPEWWAYLFQQGRVFQELEALSLQGHFDGLEMEAIGEGLASKPWGRVALRELEIGMESAGHVVAIDAVVRAIASHAWPLESLKLEGARVGGEAIAAMSQAVRGGRLLRELRELHIRHLAITTRGAAEALAGSIVEGHGCPNLYTL
jgi:hypothetical protein